MKIIEKLFVLFGIIGTILIGIGFLVFLIWTIYPYKTVEYKNDRFKVINKEVERGGLLLYDVDACKYSDIKPEVDAIFVDSIKYLSAERFAALATGCRITRVERRVPISLPPGRYHLEIIVRYKMNPIRTIIKTAETEEFEVVR
jgi:hypothetical protein